MKTITITRKIQLHASPIQKKGESEKELLLRRKEMNDKIYGLCRFNHKTANICVNRCIHYYGLDNSLYRDADKDSRNAMSRAIYADLNKFNAEDPYLSKYSKCTTNNVGAIMAEVSKNYRAEAFSVATKGDKSLTTYKGGFPLYVKKLVLNNKMFNKFNKEDFDINNIIIRLYGVDLKLFFGQDRSNNRLIVKRINSGEYSAADSGIIVKKNKIFLLLCVTMPMEEKQLDKSIVVGADLGIAVPIVASVFEKFNREYIGCVDELLKQRTAIKGRRNRLHSQLKTVKGGKGRKKKLKAMDRLDQLESNTRNNFNHIYSKVLIDFCVKVNAGTLVMEDLSKFGKNKDGSADDKCSYVLSNWSFFDLQKKIDYKAKKEGIDVHYIKPQYTSQRCSKCGHIHKDNRKSQSQFICQECGLTINADINASQNIADVFVNNLTLTKPIVTKV